MLGLGHLGITLIAGRLTRRLFPGRFPVEWLLVGAMLPDIIDKPLGHYVLGWDNGRLWGHGLALLVVLGAIAWYRASTRWTALGLGTALHQLEDQMPWTDHEAWLWPLYGPFPRDVSPGLTDWIDALLTSPYIWATETIGLAALVVLLAGPLLGRGPRWWQAADAAHGPGLDAQATKAPDDEPRT